MAPPAEHIDIRTDFAGLDPEAYREDLKKRFALSAHPDVREMEENIINMKEAAREAFETANTLRSEAADKEALAEQKAASGDDEEAERAYAAAAEKRQEADRRERIARSKTGTLKQWVGQQETTRAIAGTVDRAQRLVNRLDPVAQTKRDKIKMEAEQEIRAAAKKEMSHLLSHLKERWKPFLEAFRKAKAFNSGSATAGGFGRSLGVLDNIELAVKGGAERGVDERMDEVFEEWSA